jgi:hypothetical protein
MGSQVAIRLTFRRNDIPPEGRILFSGNVLWNCKLSRRSNNRGSPVPDSPESPPSGLRTVDLVP